MTPEEQLLRKIVRDADYLTIVTRRDEDMGISPGFTLDTTVSTYHDDFTPAEVELLLAIVQQERPDFTPSND